MLTILPLLLMAALAVFTGFEFHKYISDIQQGDNLEKAQFLKNRIEHDFAVLQSTARRAARTSGLDNAIRIEDFDFLHELAKNTTVSSPYTMTIMNRDFLVLVRSEDEFLFGDKLSFNGSIEKLKLRFVDDNHLVSFLVPVKAIDGLVGYVLITLPLTAEYPPVFGKLEPQMLI